MEISALRASFKLEIIEETEVPSALKLTFIESGTELTESMFYY